MPLIKSKISSEDLAYIAGLVDGEGCIGFTQVGQYKTWAVRVTITNTNLSILEWVQSIFGGRIQSFHGKKEWKVGYHLDIRWDSAVAFLEAIEPWLRIKKEQAWVAFGWDIVRHRGHTRSPKDGCIELLVAQMKWLNKKGIGGQLGADPMTAILQREWNVLFPDEYLEKNFEFVEEEPNASYR